MVEILNENDNFPEFAEDTVHSLDLSEVSHVPCSLLACANYMGLR